MEDQESAPRLYFLLVAQVKGMMFNPAKADGLTFHLDQEPRVDLTLKPSEADDDPFGFRRGLTCRATTNVAVSESQRDFVSSIIAGRFVPYAGMPIALPYTERGMVQIDAFGMLREGFGMPFELYPPDLQRVCDTARDNLRANMARFIRLLRWYQDIGGPYQPFDFEPTLYWKTDGELYYAVGMKSREQTARGSAGIVWNDESSDEIGALWSQAGCDEPLAHELLREANDVAQTSPRSALLIATSALETGVKNHFHRLAPQTPWLHTTRPPPVHSVLRGQIPRLHRFDDDQRRRWRNLRALFDLLEQFDDCRDEVAHSGVMTKESEDVNAYLDAVTDVLYILDALSGHEWAKGHLSHQTRQNLGWPGGRYKRFIVRVLPRWPVEP